MELEQLEGDLRLILKKNKHKILRCILNCRTKDFSIFSTTNRLLNKFNLQDCKKISKYLDDMSWEIEIKKNKAYRFVCENQTENLKWYNTINSIINKIDDNYCDHDQNLSHLDEDETFSHVSTYDKDLCNDLYEVVIDRDLTSPNFFTKLALNSIYLITIDESGISLQDKTTGHFHGFGSNIIKRYGSINDCFAFELGNNTEYGKGVIALQSNKSNSKLIYDHLNDLTKNKFNKLLERFEKKKSTNALVLSDMIQSEQVLQNKPAFQVQSQSQIQLQPLSKPQTLIVNNNNNDYFDKENAYHQVVNEYKNIIEETEKNHHNYNAYEIKIEVEKRPSVEHIITNNNLSMVITRSKFENDTDSYITETEESFYTDKYKPQYVSKRNIKAPTASEYFKDEDNNVIYGKVKLQPK